MAHHYDRRAVLRTTTLAAGLVWTRPVVRTAALVDAAGTGTYEGTQTDIGQTVGTLRGTVESPDA